MPASNYTNVGLGQSPQLDSRDAAYQDIAELYKAVFNITAQIDKVLTLSDDVRIDNANGGLILKDHQGTPHYWRVTVSNVGALIITDIGTTLP